jgi:hypothetical protein
MFFKIYQILSVFDESPSFASIIVMCWLFMFNGFSLFDYFLSDYEITSLRDSYMNITTGVLIFGGHLLYFYYKGRNVKIIKKYEKESKNLAIWGTIGTVLYVFLTILIFFKYTVPFAGGKH